MISTGFYLNFTGFFPSFPGFSLGFTGFVTRSDIVPYMEHSFTEFYLVLPSFTGFDWVDTGIDLVLPSFTGFPDFPSLNKRNHNVHLA